jgi:hypothetical protein
MMTPTTFARACSAVLAFAVAFVASASGVAGADAPHADVPTFPTVSGHDLNGRAVEIPRDLQGSANLVYVAFVPNQQAQVDSWKPFAEEMVRRYPGFHAYQLPVIASTYTVFRGYLDRVMRGAIADTAARESTITVFLNKGSFDRALGIESEGAISVFLVAPNGEILWRTTGAYDPSRPPRIAELVAARGP